MGSILHRSRLHGIDLVVAEGSITDLPVAVDCLLVSGNTEGRMGGGVSLAVLNECHPSLEHELQRVRPALGSVTFVTSSGRLATRGVRHVAYATVLRKPVDIADLGTVRSILEALFDLSDRYSIRSIAIPLIGSGVGRLGKDEVADAVVDAIARVGSRSTSSLRQVVLSAFKPDESCAYVRALDRQYEGQLDRCALVVVDMIDPFIGPGKLISAERALALASNINRLAETVRTLERPVVFVRDLHVESDPELRYVRRHCVSSHVAVYQELVRRRGDAVFDKHSYSAFTRTRFAQKLRRAGVETILLAGIQTHVCVKFTACDATALGFRPIVVGDLCAASNRQRHEAGLAEVSRYFGEVGTTRVIQELLDIAARSR